MPDLKGRVALVTGVSRGIGLAVASALIDAGADVALACRKENGDVEHLVSRAEAAGQKTVVLRADLHDMGAAAGLVAQTIGQLGRLDIVVNNAGITKDNLTLRLSDDDWNDVIAVDLSAAFAICRAALRPMIKQRSGRIINISSIAGVVGNPGQANYSAAKAGLIGMTKAIAREVGSRGITVNAVAPGFIETDMTEVLGEKTIDAAVATVPMSRMGTATEVAAAVAFLCSDGAGYITGHVLHVDGGLAA